MLLGSGRLGSTRLLGRKAVELMTCEHLGTINDAPTYCPPSLGFAVCTSVGMVHLPIGGQPLLGGTTGVDPRLLPGRVGRQRLFGVSLVLMAR